MSANGSEESRPSREIAYRMFAAEFDDASFSYSESDEERAPNYVVTPTGARVNRMFAVGVLTEVEPVNDDVLRGRIVDPTGAFVSYAGQYQPDEMAFLDRASPPAFVALSGKARTFQPDDSDRVYTSVRPESMSRVDADTRDRWTVSTAEATLHRVGVMAAALQSGLSGGDLRDALLDAGVDEALSKGVPLAIDHYGTTPAYLAALRRLALDALEVVANDRDSVRSLDREPSDAGESVDLGALAADLDLSAPARSEPVAEPPAAEPDAETAAADSADTVTAAVNTTTEPDSSPSQTSGTDEGESIPEFDEEPAAEPTADTSESVTQEQPSTVPETSTAAASTASAPDDTAADGDSAAPPSEAAASEDTGSESTPAEATATDTASETAEPAETTAATDTASETTEPAETTASADTPSTDSAASVEDDLGDFDAGGSAPPEDDLGDFETGDSASPSTSTSAASTEPASTSETAADAADEPTADAESDTDLDDDGMYQIDEDERAEIEAEFGTEFSTGSEVAPAGEADIDVPSVEELEAELDEEAAVDDDREPSDSAATTSEPVTDTASASGGEPETEPAGTESDADDDDVAADVDLETVAVEAMDALDDGDGASREAVVAHVVDEYGADPEAVEDAIQSALMSGQCYEPTEDSLKAI